MLLFVFLLLGLQYQTVTSRENTFVYHSDVNTGDVFAARYRVRRDLATLKLHYLPQFDNSAISMQGANFYVNYEQPEGNLSYVLEYCYTDARCVSFDYDGAKGWLHAISHNCASIAGAGASFNQGKASGSTFFELTTESLTEKGLNASCDNIRAAYTPDYGSMAGRIFGAAAGSLFGFGLLFGVFYFVLVFRERSQRIANIINRDVGMNDEDAGPVPLAGHNGAEGQPRVFVNQYP